MRITELLSKSGLESDSITIDVPSSAKVDVTVTISSVRMVTLGTNVDVAVAGAFPPMTKNVDCSARIPRPVWDNLIAALATQKASE